MTRPIRQPEAKVLQGHRAGFVSRIVADAIDLGVIWALGLSALLFAGVVRYLLTGPPFRIPALPSRLVAAGLRVTDRSGGRLTLRRAFVRAVLCLAFPAGLLWILVSRRNASVQDLLVGTVVAYDWSYHPADEPSPSGDASRSPSPAPRSDGA